MIPNVLKSCLYERCLAVNGRTASFGGKLCGLDYGETCRARKREIELCRNFLPFQFREARRQTVPLDLADRFIEMSARWPAHHTRLAIVDLETSSSNSGDRRANFYHTVCSLRMLTPFSSPIRSIQWILAYPLLSDRRASLAMRTQIRLICHAFRTLLRSECCF